VKLPLPRLGAAGVRSLPGTLVAVSLGATPGLVSAIKSAVGGNPSHHPPGVAGSPIVVRMADPIVTLDNVHVVPDARES
jgi:hypothetical protein